MCAKQLALNVHVKIIIIIIIAGSGTKSVSERPRLWSGGSSDRSITVDPFNYISFQLVLQSGVTNVGCILFNLRNGAYKNKLLLIKVPNDIATAGFLSLAM